MSRRSMTLVVMSASLIAGACAGKIHVDATVVPPPVVAVETVEVATLPVMSIRFDQLLLPSENVAVVNEDAKPAYNLTERIEKARQLLENIPVDIGTTPFRYTEYRGGSAVTFKDPEKHIALALMDELTGELETTIVTKRGDKITTTDGYVIEPVTRTNGIRWNNWATEFEVSQPEGKAVVALKYPYQRDERVARQITNKAGKRVTVYDTKRVVVPVYYTPYSKELHLPELVRGGEEHLSTLIARVYEDLRAQKVPSRAVPGTLVADVPALHAEYITRLAPNEHMDMTEFLLDPAWTTERIHVVIGANKDRVATYTCSKASACGLMQFTAGTYGFMRAQYPTAGLIARFEDGARDQFNSMKAAVLLHDDNTAQLIGAFGEDILQDPKLEEYLAAAYNTGVGRVIAVLSVAKKTNAADWAEVTGKRSGERLLLETKGYIAKLRFLRDRQERSPLAQAIR